MTNPEGLNRALRWSKFVRNVYEMAMNPENSRAIGFSSDGLCLEIRDAKLLSSEVLQKYFKHKNVSSFIRQLNNYGFKTIPVLLSSSLAHCFAHDYFRKDRLDLLEGVVRKQTKGDTHKISEKLCQMKERDLEVEKRMVNLKRLNEQLVQQNQELMDENKRLKASWSAMQEAVMRYPKPVDTRKVVNPGHINAAMVDPFHGTIDFAAPELFPMSGYPLFMDEI
jgi:hypothetical protein